MIDFSVLIPVLNEAPYIKLCLDALQHQQIERERFEIIVIDNGSTDGTLDAVRSYPDVVLLHEPKPDPYLARNRGIAAARGRILAFTDGDCRAGANWLAALERAFHDGADIAIGRLVHPQGSSFWLERYVDYYNTKTRWVFDRPDHEVIYAHAGNMAVRAQVFETIGRFAELPVAGDTEILHRACEEMNAPVIRYVDDAVVTHLEVQRLRDMLPKLFRYGAYATAANEGSRYRVLSTSERLTVALRCARDHHYGPTRVLGLLFTLAMGFVSFEWGRRRPSGGNRMGGPPG